MKIKADLIDIQCNTPMQSARDALSIVFAFGSDSGDIDRLQSDTSTISNPLQSGPYEIGRGTTLRLSELPPLNRQNWLTNPIEVGETNRASIALTGVGLHKATLGGGADPESLAFKAVRAAITTFIEKIPYVGKVAKVIVDYAVDLANKEPDKNCIGVLFVFKKEYLGQNLIMDLLKSGSAHTKTITFLPADGERVNVSTECRRPSYQATLRLSLEGRVTIDQQISSNAKSKSPQQLIPAKDKDCDPKSPMYIWVARSLVTCRLTPQPGFSTLRYGWTLNGVAIDGQAGSATIPASVERYNETNIYGDKIATKESVTVSFKLAADGSLEVRCPHTSGQFRLDAHCFLDSESDSVRVAVRNVWISCESIGANEAYDKYSRCTAAKALFRIREKLATKVVDFTIPRDPQPLENEVWMQDWTIVGTKTRSIKADANKIAKAFDLAKPMF